VLRAFIAMVGMKPVADVLLGVKNALSHPFRDFTKLWGFGRKQVEARVWTPQVPVNAPALRPEAHELGKRVNEFGRAVQSMLTRHREGILERQYVQERIADAACDLYAASCTLSRLDSLLSHGNGDGADVNKDIAAGKYFLRLASRRIRQNLAALHDNVDEQTTATANASLKG